jgi:hypothetical protein
LKPNRQPSIEEVEDIDNIWHHLFLWNPQNILESSDNNDEATKKATNISKPTLAQKKEKTCPETEPLTISQRCG